MSSESLRRLTVVIALTALFTKSVWELFAVVLPTPWSQWQTYAIYLGVPVALLVILWLAFRLVPRLSETLSRNWRLVALLTLFALLTAAAPILLYTHLRLSSYLMFGWLALVNLGALGVAILIVRKRSLVELQEPGTPAKYEYDFIEHFDDSTTIKNCAAVFPLRVIRQAASMGEVNPAIFAHPAAHAETILTYEVEKIPARVKQVQLEFFTGILDIRRHETTGELLEVSRFHQVPGNRIGFEIRVNDQPVFTEEMDTLGWSQLEQVGLLVPVNNRVDISFRTDALGNDHWNWAAWGEPRLTEVPPTSSAAG